MAVTSTSTNESAIDLYARGELARARRLHEAFLEASQRFTQVAGEMMYAAQQQAALHGGIRAWPR